MSRHLNNAFPHPLREESRKTGGILLMLGAVFAVSAPCITAQAQTVHQRSIAFQTIDGSKWSRRAVQAGAAEASHDKIAIVIWGGDRALQQQAYNAALDLRDSGIPLAFILGPSRLPTDETVMIDIYGRGVSATHMMQGIEKIDSLRSDLRAEARAAYQRMFPQ